MSPERRFSLIGPGRAGLSMAGALEQVGWERTASYGRNSDIADAASDVELCLVATPDSAISEVAERLRGGDAVLVHLSGALPPSVLGSGRVAALHPLVSLAEPASGAAQLRSAWFAVAGHRIAEELARDLSGKWFAIADEDRVIYHAAAVIASNHVTALLGQVERLAHAVGVPVEAFVDLTRGSVDNVARLGAARALTGPAARGDKATITAHIEELTERMPAEVAAYSALVTEARRLAGQDPRAD